MNNIKCKFGLHEFEVYKEEPYLNVKGNQIGTIIISRCKHCGKISTKRVETVDYRLCANLNFG